MGDVGTGLKNMGAEWANRLASNTQKYNVLGAPKTVLEFGFESVVGMPGAIHQIGKDLGEPVESTSLRELLGGTASSDGSAGSSDRARRAPTGRARDEQ